jgi:EAL domain-containing protein (putative c-di-GMP-specific phosphodiesterase class I)
LPAPICSSRRGQGQPHRLHRGLLQLHAHQFSTFGTGYSSLSYLKKFDIDYLKIDRSFTRNLAPDSSAMALSSAIIVMAHKLGLKVIAEGVETPEQRDLLAAAGCDYGQGYLFAKPMPAEEFDQLLRRQSP